MTQWDVTNNSLGKPHAEWLSKCLNASECWVNFHVFPPNVQVPRFAQGVETWIISLHLMPKRLGAKLGNGFLFLIDLIVHGGHSFWSWKFRSNGKSCSTAATTFSKSTGVPWCVASLLCVWPGQQTWEVARTFVGAPSQDSTTMREKTYHSISFCTFPYHSTSLHHIWKVS
jgi:hypothetical protein